MKYRPAMWRTREIREEADACEQALVKALREDSELQELCLAAGLDWRAFDSVCALLANYPMKFLQETPEEIATRNRDFLAAIERFKSAVERYQGAFEGRVRDLNQQFKDYLHQKYSPQFLDKSTIESEFDIRRHPPQVIERFLLLLAEDVQEGDYDVLDSQVTTPTGQRARTDSSIAAWLSIRCFSQFQHHCSSASAFNDAIALAATRLQKHTEKFRLRISMARGGEKPPKSKTFSRDEISRMRRN